MNSIFHMMNNLIVLNLIDLLHSSQPGAVWPKNIVKNKLVDKIGYEPTVYDKANEVIETLFEDENGQLHSILPRPMAFPISKGERMFLKALAIDKEYAFLLSPALRQKLQELLKDEPDPIPDGAWIKERAPGDDPSAEPLFSHLRTVMEAFLQNRQISYETQNGQAGMASPCRLSYDLAANTYTLRLWDSHAKSLLSFPMADMKKLTLSDVAIPSDMENQFEAYRKEHLRSVTLHLHENKGVPKRNAFHRCFALFSTYDKDVFYDSQNDIYQLNVQYYDFDEEEVIRRILSLSRFVTVAKDSPELRSKIIHRLKAMCSLYQDK